MSSPSASTGTSRESLVALGVAMLGFGMIWLEFLAFRLCRAVFGSGFAHFLVLACAAAAALGGAVAAIRSVGSDRSWFSRAAHWTAAAGALCCVAIVSVVWSSQKITSAKPDAPFDLYTRIVIAAWMLCAFCLGAALASTYRARLGSIGSNGFAQGLGAAVGALSFPYCFELAGGPRLGMALGILLGLAAVIIALRPHRAIVQWGVVATVPLAATALFAGDVGAPWLNTWKRGSRRSIVTDDGARIDIVTQVWTERGFAAAKRPHRAKSAIIVEGGAPVEIAAKGQQKPRFVPQDLPYSFRKKPSGRVLVIGSVGLREAQVALAYDHERVDLIEPNHALVQRILIDEHGKLHGDLLRSPAVTVHFGRPRAVLETLPADYQRIVVMGNGGYADPATRFVSRDDGLYTREALRAYLLHIADDGAVVVQAARPAMPALIAAAREVLGGDEHRADERIFMCSDDAIGALLLTKVPMDKGDTAALGKQCKGRFPDIFPVERPRKGHRKFAEKLAEAEASEAALVGGAAIVDDTPFFEPPMALRDLPKAALAAFRALGHERRPTPKVPPKAKGKDAASEAPPEPEPRRTMSMQGIEAATALVAALALLVVMASPVPRRRGARAVRALYGSLPLFGAALAIAMIALGERAIAMLGHEVAAVSIVVPVALVGIGGGRLCVDALSRHRLRVAGTLLGGCGVIAQLGLFGLGDRLAGVGVLQTSAVVISGIVIVVAGVLLGAPLAAVLRLLAERQPPRVAWGWGAHQAGWALGAASVAVLVRHVGFARLLACSAILYAAAVVLMAIGARQPVSTESP